MSLKYKDLLRGIKAQSEKFEVPQPSANFERRLLDRLHSSPEWNRQPWFVWNRRLVWAVGSAAFVLLLVVSGVRIVSVDPTATTSIVAQRNQSDSAAIISSMAKRGGQEALKTWIQANGDLSELDNFVMSPSDQKRVLADLEKKWNPAL